MNQWPKFDKLYVTRYAHLPALEKFNFDIFTPYKLHYLPTLEDADISSHPFLKFPLLVSVNRGISCRMEGIIIISNKPTFLFISATRKEASQIYATQGPSGKNGPSKTCFLNNFPHPLWISIRIVVTTVATWVSLRGRNGNKSRLIVGKNQRN